MKLNCRALLVGGLLAAVLFPTCLGQEVPAPRLIRKITFQGLKRLSAPTITAKLKIKIGQVYDPDAVGEETGQLYRMGDFSRVEDPQVRDFEDGVEVIFIVEEKPRVAAVRIEARDTPSGKPSISQQDIRDAIDTKPDGRLSPYSLKQDAETIRRMYLEKGYSFVEVSHATREVPTGVEVSFSIDEGSDVRVQEVAFVGNSSIDAGQLRSVMETSPRDFLFGLIRKGYYNETTLQRDVNQVTNYYRSKGFFEARAAVETLEFDYGLERLRIVIRVEEGPRYVFLSYGFVGNRVFSTQVLAPLCRAPVGQPYDEERVREDQREIVKYYSDRAYIYARVEPQFEWLREGTEVRVTFKIEEGREIEIEYVKVRKNEDTQDNVIRRELEFYPGEKVNFSKIEKSKSNIARLQIFKDVNIGFEPGSSPEKNNVLVDVEEQQTGQLILGFGVTSGFGIIGNFTIQKRNFDITDLPESLYDIQEAFTGDGQTLSLVLQPGTERSLYRIAFTEPYLFDSRNSLTLAGDSLRIIRDDFDEDRLSFSPRIGHAFDFDRDLVFTVGARIQEIEIHDIEADAPPDVFDVEGFTTIIAASTGLAYDKVLYDRWEGAFDGFRPTVTYEYGGDPLGGEVDFHRIESSMDLYFPLYVHEAGQLHHVIGLFSKVGAIEGHHNTDSIPIFERFFLGGPNTVRGFKFRGLGPHVGHDPVGGTAAWYGNVEYVFPLFQKFLRGVVFFDYGNLSTDLETFDLAEMRLAVGVGIRVIFPFLGGQPLPIGLYLGEAFRKEDDDRTRSFLFTIGAPF